MGTPPVLLIVSFPVHLSIALWNCIYVASILTFCLSPNKLLLHLRMSVCPELYSSHVPYHEPAQSNPYNAILFFKTTLTLSSPIWLDLPSGLVLSGFLTKTLCTFLFSPTRDTCPCPCHASRFEHKFSPLLSRFIYCRRMVYWYYSRPDSNVRELEF